MSDNLLRLLRRCGATGADGPDRFIRDDPRIRRRRTLQRSKDSIQLPVHHGESLSAISFVTGLTDGENHLEAVRQGRHELLANLVIALTEDVAAFGVADEHEVAPSGEHHR